MFATSHLSPLTSRLIDSHAHFDSFALIDKTLQKAKAAGIEKIIAVGFDEHCNNLNIKLVKKYDFIFASVGLHPHQAHDFNQNSLNELRGKAKDKKVVAIGETGLDYHYLYSSKEEQIKSFKSQIDLANELKLPLIIHSRSAEQETVSILKEKKPASGFVLHCYSGDLTTANKAIALGGFISFTGNITFKNAQNIRDVAQKIPLGKILIETDSPYLAPEPLRGKTNEPANLPFIAEKLAQIKKESLDKIAKATYENTKQLFQI